MFLKNSRYANATPFVADEAGDLFEGVRARAIGPAEGVVEHEVRAGDRLDQLARYYYNDDRLWWRIVDANPRFTFASLLLSDEMAGQVILIPKARE